MSETKILDQDDIEFIEKAHGQLSAGEIALTIKVDVFTVSRYLKQLGAPRQYKEMPSWARVRPPAVYSNRKKQNNA